MVAGTTSKNAKAAVELAAEIGISEALRANNGIPHAMASLYLMKRKKMGLSEFLDPKVGFTGAGTGGAENLRLKSEQVFFREAHREKLEKVFAEHTKNKLSTPGKEWAKGVEKSDPFLAWLKHKQASWMKRSG
jgi:hypothetical protein